MHPIEASSSISRSATSKTDGGKTLLLIGKQNKVDVVFPLFEQYLTNVKLPSFIFLFFKTYVILQGLLSAIWPMAKFTFSGNLPYDNVFSVFKVVLFFMDYAKYTDYIDISAYLCLTVIVIIIGFLGFQLWYYINKRSFMKWSLYVTKIIVDIICPCVLLPCGYFLGIAFLEVFTNPVSKHWFHFFLGLLSYIVIALVFGVSSSFSAHSVIISPSIFPSFDSTPLMHLLIGNSLVTCLSFGMSVFPTWMELIVPISHIIWFSIAMGSVFTFPYHSIYDNVIMVSIYIENLVMDIFTIIFFFIKCNYKWAPFIVVGSSFAISLIVMYFIIKKIRKSIKKDLNYDDFNNDDEAAEYYTSLGLDTNQNKALKYLYNGVAQHCKGIIDVNYLKFIYKNHTENKLLISTMQIITFFPSETRTLNALFKAISCRRDLSYAERFIIYQIYRVKSLRASSSLNTTNDLIIELKELNGQVEANIRNFWTMTNANYTFAEKLSKEINSAEIQWKEAIEAYPNNEKISQEYSRFLTECKCNFDDAIYQRQITEMIENGHNFAVDNSFRSFVRTFPKYLLNEILDLHGKKIKNSKGDKNGSKSSSHNAGSSGTNGLSSSSFTIDAEMEEAIGKRILRNSRMRIALHHSIDDMKSPLNKWMYASAAVMIISCFAAYVALFIYMDDQFRLRSDAVACMNHISSARYYVFMMFNAFVLNYAKLNGKIGNETNIVGNFTEVDKPFNYYWDLSIDLGFQTMYYAQEVKNALTRLFKALADLSAKAVDVYSLSGSLLNEQTKVSFCKDAKPLRDTASTIKNKVIFSVFEIAMSTGKGFVKDIFSKNEMCETTLNVYGLPTDFGPVFSLFDDKQIKEGDDLVYILNIFIIYIPIAIVILSFIPIFIINIVYLHKYNNIIKIFQELDPDTKEEARNPISLDAEITNQTSNISADSKVSKACFIMLIILLFTILQALLIYLFIDHLRKNNNEIIDVGKWYTRSVDRLCGICETFCDALMVVLMENDTDYIKRQDNVKWISIDKQVIVKSNDCLLRGCEGVKTSYGYHDYVDKIHFQERCDVGDGLGTLHDIYGCASISQQISVFSDIIQEIAYNPDINNNSINNEKMMNLYHITSHHLIGANNDVIYDFRFGIEAMHDIVYNKSVVYLVFGIILAVCEFIAFIFYVQHVSSIFQIILIFIKHLSPTQLLASKELMDFILNRTSKEDDKAMGTAQSIVHSTIDAILCTGLNGIVELSNPAVTTLLGYTPDQILGQHIDNFLTPESQEEVNKQMSLMQNGQSAATYDGHISCVSDSAVEINFYVTIIGMKGEGSNNISSFVFILSDETELLRQQKEAEEAKARSEKLLYQILPKDIVVKLNRGEKDISFTVPSSTIIFIDIVKFSEYASTLTPQEIMGNLSVIFASFDQNVAKYPVITKIKLIGDVYMAAAGLFLPADADPQLHAEATLRFGIDCINELEDVNMKLNASLEVRVGVNTGGPLIAGVLGTDKPTFDIIGDPINISSRLQSTDIPGKIQISRATYDIVSQLGFNIEERGEVFLKGKGKQMTYIVHPHVVFMGQSGSILSTTDLSSATKMQGSV